MNHSEIMRILPHPEDMLLEEATTVGRYHVRRDEFSLRGHFPDNPIVPGVILCKILAQSACVLMIGVLQESQIPVYTGLNNVKFCSPVRPDDTIEARTKIQRARHPFYFAEGKICVEGRLCASAPFSFALTGA